MRVLVVEDDPKMGTLLMRGLERQGFECRLEQTGEEALAVLGGESFDVIVLDVMLPGIDGFVTCKRMRGGGSTSPVLMLTARVAVDDRVHGLDAGADDYLAKPFAFAELLARVRALTRRGVDRRSILRVGELRLDTQERRAWRADAEISLSPRELALLEAFMLHPDQALTRTQLLQHAWPYDHHGASNVVDVYVRYLREKIDLPFDTASLETVRGVGYRLTAA
jgi:two-component system OmpR family response regulator